MKLLRTVPVFLSGFAVYGIVATLVGADPTHADGPMEILADPVPNASAESGTRLKAQYLLGNDGSKDYQVTLTPWIQPNLSGQSHPTNLYYDALRQEQCSFSIAGDGSTRCLPVDWVADPYLLYSDSGCGQRMVPITGVQPGCTLTVPKYAMQTDYSSVCPVVEGWYQQHYFPIGAFLGPNLSTCYKLQSNVCTLTSCPNNGGVGFAYYALGAEVPATSFVAGTQMTDP